ncbi:MAG: DUF2683 family protein [Flavobacterium sp.]
METLIIHTEGEKLKTIKNLLKLLDVKYEKKKDKSAYNPEFVKKILERSQNNNETITFDENYKRLLKNNV